MSNLKLAKKPAALEAISALQHWEMFREAEPYDGSTSLEEYTTLISSYIGYTGSVEDKPSSHHLPQVMWKNSAES